jgi:hypothetical protein
MIHLEALKKYNVKTFAASMPPSLAQRKAFDSIANEMIGVG